MEEIAASLGNYISQYGYGALFGLFFLGILGMPLPEETLLVFSGFLVSTGKLELFPTFLVCFLGSISAMTTAYWIGRTLGFSFIERYGRRFGLGYTLYQKTEDWFNRVGKWALPLGYFIPGVRQFTAYFAGITRLPFPTFMLYTYSGGLFWSILFVTLGWQLGERWDELFGLISRNLAIFFLVLLAAIAAWSFLAHAQIHAESEEESSLNENQSPPSGENLPAVQKPRELVPIELPEQHQRFYDKLRAKIEAFIREHSGNEAVAKYILLAPDLFVLLARLLVDKRVGMQAKAIAGAAVAYFISPIDFIPEALTGGFGLIDDVVFAVYALRKILVDVEESIVREHWNGEEDLLRVITRVIRSADELLGKKLVKKIEQTLFRKK